MSKLLKRVGGFVVAVVLIVLAKFKAAGIFAVKVLIVSLIHSALGNDSTATASASRPQHAKPARQVAQAVPNKPNPADKLAGPMAPATSSPAVTPRRVWPSRMRADRATTDTSASRAATSPAPTAGTWMAETIGFDQAITLRTRSRAYRMTRTLAA